MVIWLQILINRIVVKQVDAGYRSVFEILVTAKCQHMRTMFLTALLHGHYSQILPDYRFTFSLKFDTVHFSWGKSAYLILSYRTL